MIEQLKRLLPLFVFFAAQPFSVAASDCARLGEDHIEATVNSPEGKLLRSRCFKGDTPDGPAREYGEDGRLLLEGQYKDGEMDGDWVRYYPNGVLKDRGRWNKGKPVGHWVKNYENGKPRFDGEFSAQRRAHLPARGLGADGKQIPASSEAGALAVCERSFFPTKRLIYYQLIAGGLGLMQTSGGLSVSPFAGATAHLRLGSLFSIGLGLEISTLLTQSTPRYMWTAQANLGIYLAAFRWVLVGIGGGAQMWINMVRPYPEVQAELVFKLPFKPLWVIQNIHLSGTVFFYPGDTTYISRIGLGIPI